MNRNSTRDPKRNKVVEAALKLVDGAAKRREAGVPVSPEDEKDGQLVAFMLIGEIHKRGPSLVVENPFVRGHFIERTPEQQAEYEHAIRYDARGLAREATAALFTTGRKAGTKGTIRKAVASLLKKHPDMKNPQLWDALKAKPPKGCEFCNNSLGEYIDRPGGYTSYATFRNICSEERKEQRQRAPCVT